MSISARKSSKQVLFVTKKSEVKHLLEGYHDCNITHVTSNEMALFRFINYVNPHFSNGVALHITAEASYLIGVVEGVIIKTYTLWPQEFT